MGDLVIRENINKTITNDKIKGKFEPLWYVIYVVDAIGLGAYKLSSMDGKEEPNKFNSIHLKHLYV